MKKVLFDLYNAQPDGESKYHGGGEYIKTVFKCLACDFSKKCELIVFYDDEKFMDDWVIRIINKKNIKQYNVKELSEIKGILASEKIDILYSGLPYRYKKEWIPSGVNFKGTIHGLRQIELPTDKYAKYYLTGKKRIKEIVKYIMKKEFITKKYKDFKNLIAILDEVYVTSNHTRYAIKYWYPESLNKKVKIFYPPSKEFEYSKKESSIFEFPYLLMISANRWEKNSYRMILAIENLLSKGFLKNYKIVIIGNLSKKVMKAIHHKNNYIFKNYVEVEELEDLYKYCEVFLYVSLNEGFGYPPLEAMKYGKTCVVSGVCSIPEVCGDAAYIVNPYDINEISGRILNAVDNPVQTNIVLQRFNYINKRQVYDLGELCRSIID